jgi:hypothetical protein
MHQITAFGLYKLLKAAYNDYCIDVSEDQPSVVLCFENWCNKTRISESSGSILAYGAVDGTTSCDDITHPGT